MLTGTRWSQPRHGAVVRRNVRQNFMNVELACFLLGLAATGFWLSGLRQGVMLGWKNLLFASGTGLIRRSADAAAFWIATVVVGCLALGLLILTVLSWIGLRH